MSISLVEIHIHVYLYGSQIELNHVVKTEYVLCSGKKIGGNNIIVLNGFVVSSFYECLRDETERRFALFLE